MAKRFFFIWIGALLMLTYSFAFGLEYPSGFPFMEVPDPLSGANPAYPLISRSHPAIGEPFFDSRFGTILTRVTQIDELGARHEYSRLDPFNKDRSMIVLRPEYDWRVYRTQTFPYNQEANLVTVLHDIAEPRWDPNDPHLVWGLQNFKLLTVDVLDETTIIKDFANDPTIKAILQSEPDIYRIAMKDEGESYETACLSRSNPYDLQDQPALVYYVAPNGNDSNPGTETQPWLTIQHAADIVEAGSTVYVRGGTYRQRVTINVSGSADAGFVTFRNCEGETPVLDGTDLTVPDEVNGMFLIIDQSYLIIKGFEICNYRTSLRNRTPSGIYVGGASHHIQLRNNRIHHIESNAPVDRNRLGADAHGIVVNGTSAPDSIHEIIIDGNELYEMKLGSSEALVLSGNVEHFTVSNNIIHDVDNIGIDLAGFWGVCPNESYDQARSGIVSGNRVYNVSSFGNPAYDKVYAAGGIYVDGGKDIMVEANIVHEADIGIEIASEQHGRATSGITVQNNLLYYNNAAGIAMGGYDTDRGRTENCLVVNNSLYKNDTQQQGSGEFMIQFDALNNIITNNILYANDSNLFMSNPYMENSNNLVDYNLYFAPGGISEGLWQWKNKSYTGFDQYRSGTGNDSHSLFADPKFVNASGANFHLREGSPAIDKGSPLNAPTTDYEGNIRPYGSGYDIGAYEYGGSACTYSIYPTSQNFGTNGGPGTVNVTATSGCAWTAVSNATWITITSGANGSGNGSVNYSVSSNTGPDRIGTLTMAGKMFTVSQTGGGGAAPRYPFPQHVTYGGGTIRPNQRTQIEQDDDVRAFYDGWKADFVLEAGEDPFGKPLYRIAFGKMDPNREETVSEGQGFGMLIVALMAGYDPDAQTIFDGLWRFTKAHPSRIDPRLMGWQVPEDPGGNSSAFDGDCDMAYALLLADKQWGSTSDIDYHAEAVQLITAILESTIGPDSRLPMLGDWVDPYARKYNQYTPRSSDFMLGHFRAFGRATGDPVWSQIVTAVQEVIDSLQKKYSPKTGLLPDFIKPVSSTNHTPKPAPSNFLESAFDGSYYYNATRDPWRLGTDALLNNDARSLVEVRKISNWIQTAAAGVPANIRAGYTLTGKPLAGSNYFTTLFVAPFGVAAMTQSSQQQWLNGIYNAVYNVHEDYFEDSVTLLCLLVMTGNYWDPTAVD